MASESARMGPAASREKKQRYKERCNAVLRGAITVEVTAICVNEEGAMSPDAWKGSTEGKPRGMGRTFVILQKPVDHADDEGRGDTHSPHNRFKRARPGREPLPRCRLDHSLRLLHQNEGRFPKSLHAHLQSSRPRARTHIAHAKKVVPPEGGLFPGHDDQRWESTTRPTHRMFESATAESTMPAMSSSGKEWIKSRHNIC